MTPLKIKILLSILNDQLNLEFLFNIFVLGLFFIVNNNRAFLFQLFIYGRLLDFCVYFH